MTEQKPIPFDQLARHGREYLKIVFSKIVLVLGYSMNPDLCLMTVPFFFLEVKPGYKIIANKGNAELMLLK